MKLSLLDDLRAKNPIVFNVSNFVTVQDVANGINAIGASPIMSEEVAEADEMVGLAGAVCLNLGAVTATQVTQIRAVGQSANRQKRPLVIDPVAVGAVKYRMQMATGLLADFRPDVIRGNAGEIAALAERIKEFCKGKPPLKIITPTEVCPRSRQTDSDVQFLHSSENTVDDALMRIVKGRDSEGYKLGRINGDDLQITRGKLRTPDENDGRFHFINFDEMKEKSGEVEPGFGLIGKLLEGGIKVNQSDCHIARYFQQPADPFTTQLSCLTLDMPSGFPRDPMAPSLGRDIDDLDETYLQLLPFTIRPFDDTKPKPQRRVVYYAGTPYFKYYMGGTMKTTHTDSHYYNKLTESLNNHFKELLGDNFDLLESEAATWFDGEEEALPGSPLGMVQARCVEAGAPAKGYRHLHMFKSVTKDGVRHDRLAMMPIVETLCYKR